MEISKQFSQSQNGQNLHLIPAPLSEPSFKPAFKLTNSFGKHFLSISSAKMRMDLVYNKSTFHFSRISCEENAKLILEFFASSDLPAPLKHFSTPIAILKSNQDNLFIPRKLAYLISESPKNHVPLNSSKLSKYRIRIVGKIISAIASLHSLGLLVGDTSVENIALKNKIQPIFRSAGHMRAMSAMGEGISEFLLLLCNLMHIGTIVADELIHLIRHYLATDKNAYLHAKYYLHSQKDKNSSKIDEALKVHLLTYYSKYFS